MAARKIAVHITVENRQAILATNQQTAATNALSHATDKHTHLQNGLTNSFIKGNLAARAISVAYINLSNSLQFAVREAINFEHNMTKISAITGATGGTLSSLERTIRGVAVATNQSQNEMARAALEMGKIGLSGKQVEDALGGIASLARALDEDVVRAGETVVAVLNTYGIEARNADMVTNQLAFTVKSSALDIQSFGTAFSYVGGTAAAAGVKFEELQASMDVLSNSGIKASTIGTQLRRIIADLSNENSKASAVLGGKTLKDYNSFADALQALADKNLSVSDYTEIFGRTASSVAAILTKYTGNIKDLTKATLETEGALAPMTALMNTTLKSNVDGISTAWAEWGIELSKSNGLLKEFLGLVKDAINGAAKFQAQKNQVAQFKASDPAGFKAANAEALKAMGKQDAFITAPASMIARTNAFKDFQVALGDREWLDKTKANIQQEIMDILDKDFAKQVAAGKGKAGDIPFAAGSKDKQRFLESMFTGQSQVFWAEHRKAQAKLAQSLEQVPLESGIPDGLFDSKSGKTKKSTVWNYPKLLDGDFFEKEASLNAKEDKAGHDAYSKKYEAQLKFNKQLEEASDEYPKLSAAMERYREGLTLDSIAVQHLDFAMQSLGGSTGVFGDLIVDSFLGHKDAFSDFQDAFGNMAKNFVSELIAMQLRILAFKAAMGIFSLFSGGAAGTLLPGGGAPAFLPAGVGLAASGMDQVVDRPTMIMAGEAGRERVTVTPRSKMGSSGSAKIVVNIHGDVLDGQKFTEAVNMAQKNLNRSMV